ncbi:MAG TPA: NAD(P)-dependent oxidoreductase [Polyangiaceae bacterium]|nr:NAD(P)-dependent oxidoreductase [Polyangiaceae bacterium]
MKLGFVGLGSMGFAMAESLLAQGHQLFVYNRSHEKAQPLHEAGARLCATPAEAAREAEAVISMVADDAALETVTFGASGILAELPASAVHISCSTISVALSERLAAAHAQMSRGYVAAPVFGRPEAAVAKKLWLLVAGKSADVERSLPVLQALGRGVTRLGENASQANLVKLTGNVFIASLIESLGESFALARKGGVSPELMLDLFKNVFGQGSLILENYAAQVARGNHEHAGFKAKLGLKDLRLALSAADRLEVPLPTASLLHDQLLSAVATGQGELDWSVLAQVAAKRAGL